MRGFSFPPARVRSSQLRVSVSPLTHLSRPSQPFSLPQPLPTPPTGSSAATTPSASTAPPAPSASAASATRAAWATRWARARATVAWGVTPALAGASASEALCVRRYLTPPGMCNSFVVIAPRESMRVRGEKEREGLFHSIIFRFFNHLNHLTPRSTPPPRAPPPPPPGAARPHSPAPPNFPGTAPARARARTLRRKRQH